MTDSGRQAYFEGLGHGSDQSINLAQAAVMLSRAITTPVSRQKYLTHIKQLEADTKARFDVLLKAGAQDNARTRLAALKHILSDTCNYRSPSDQKSDITETADLARVIENREGTSCALCILYAQVARHNGWKLDILSIAGIMLCRLETDGERLIFNPAQQCTLMQAHDLRIMLKESLGQNAELSAQYYEQVSNRYVLITLQNNIKSHFIENGDYSAAHEIVEEMRCIDPDEYRLLLDAGVLSAKLHQMESAIKSLEAYAKRAPIGSKGRQEALLLLHEIREGYLA